MSVPTASTESTVSSELATIAKNPTVKEKAVVKGKLDPTVAAAWLTLLVQTEVAKAANEKAGTKIAQADRNEAKNWASGYFGDQATFDKFPKSFRDAVERAVRRRFLRTSAPTPRRRQQPRCRTAYDESLVRNCASGRYVSHILVATEDQAKAAAAELAAGADFKTVASKTSTDARLRTARRRARLPRRRADRPDLRRLRLPRLPLGGVSAPVKSQFGWHIIKVEDVATALPFDTVKDEIRTDLIEQGPVGRSKLQKAMAGAKVKVAAKYGRWVVKDGTGQVTPPKSASTSTTTAPSSSSTSTTTTKP